MTTSIIAAALAMAPPLYDWSHEVIQHVSGRALSEEYSDDEDHCKFGPEWGAWYTASAVGVIIGLGVGALTGVYLEEIRQAVLWAFGVDLFPLDVYNLTRVPCRIEPLWLVQVTAMAMATGLIVSVLPALRAARHDPLISLRGI